ncbi:DUF4271 domain-containing protein [Mucilaginibacter gotjawali]|uniref:DUF4271 domain-containing protein n=1 Tax=Mucilaginibacter gotjawali TaxID=1550579 RepID=A0A839SCH8_9SPHI|nr:DUF4271 domain-containing protein [Mucilaginibacter gotjawali]MBB3054973.1 hypothetical protein [Mucilaginibacter gotjawali]
MRFTVFCCLLLLFCCFGASGRQDKVAAKDQNVLKPVDPNTVNPFLPDSVVKANKEKHMQDSIVFAYLIPDSLRSNHVMDSIRANNLYKMLSGPSAHLKKREFEQSGFLRSSRDPWIIAVVLGLLIFTGFLNAFLGNDIKNVLRSFYNSQAISQTDKEGGLINSWAFPGLFILFSLSLGLLLYQLTQYYNISYRLSGFALFISFAAIISLLMAFKFIILKFIGFIFQLDTLVSEYITVLNLTYFTMAFILLIVAICFSLLASRFIPLLLNFTLAFTVLIFLWQYLRNSMNIISDLRFHKFYLFVYLCALEICPVLIIIKALNL